MLLEALFLTIPAWLFGAFDPNTTSHPRPRPWGWQ